MWSPDRQAGETKIIGPAYTVQFVRSTQTQAPKLSHHHIDTVPRGSVILLSAPAGIPNAVYGGLMSHRAQYLGAVGVVIDGNFRDLDEQRSILFPVFARDVATPAYYEVARASQIGVPLRLNDSQPNAVIEPGDWIVADLNGVVCIPKNMLQEVAHLLPSLAEANQKIVDDIRSGIGFVESSEARRAKS